MRNTVEVQCSKMSEEHYLRNLEGLVASQKMLDVVLSQITQMTQLIELRDREITEMRERAAEKEAPVSENARRLPYNEIAAQIPLYSYEDDTIMTLETWLRKVESVRVAYGLSGEELKYWQLINLEVE